MFRDILVHVDASDQGKRRFDAAVAFAGACDARLSALYVIAPPPATLYAAGMAPVAAAGLADARLHAEMLEPLEAERDEVRDRLRALAQEAGLDFQWLDSEGPVAGVIGAFAQCSDLAIVGQEPEQPEGGHTVPVPSPGSIVLETGRPVLVIPESGRCDLPGGRALVAWNATSESARALHDALPLLQLCESVTVQTFVEQGAADEAPAAGFDVAAHLARHGIDCRWHREHTDDDTGEALLDRAAKAECGLLVMGAYGHSRLREYVFGGVTRHVLGNATIPVLIAH